MKQEAVPLVPLPAAGAEAASPETVGVKAGTSAVGLRARGNC